MFASYSVGYNVEPGSSGFSADYGIRDDGENIYGAEYTGDNFSFGVTKEEGSEPFFEFKKKLKKKEVHS